MTSKLTIQEFPDKPLNQKKVRSKRPRYTLSRQQRAEISQETLHILETGKYTTSDENQEIDISKELSNAQQNTFFYRKKPNNPFPTKRFNTKISFTEETTLSACKRLYQNGHRVCALNFASAKNPGGGFLKGSEAQEESIARSSGLYLCLIQKQEYYAENSKRSDGFYTHNIIFSKDVPVFRDDAYNLVKPFYVSIVTCPAVNAGVVLKKGGSIEQVNQVMFERIDRILNCMLGYDAIVLGAYGCGVFRNKISTVAQLFKKHLETKYKGCWKEVVFAVYGENHFHEFKNSYTKAIGPMK